MRLATSNEHIHTQGLRAAMDRLLRPAVGFTHPRDVLKDPLLGHSEKRAILASWASDACAVQDEPQLRWMLGSPEPVSLADIREALATLDRREGAGGGASH